MTTIDQMEWDVGDYYYPALVDNVKYILKDMLICIIKEHCSNQEDSK